MPKVTGRNVSLSLPRRFIIDMMHFAQKVPSVPVQRRMNVAAVVGARQATTQRPTWVSIFTKAYAIVADRWPELRRAYLAFPTPHFYEHPTSIASIAVERQLDGENAVFFGQVNDPARRSLAELDHKLQRLREEPIEDIGSFRRVLNMSRWPRPIRRLLWWTGLNAWGAKRAHFFGTFGVSVYAGLGASSLHPLSPGTSTLNYGVIDENGFVDVRLIYDHRVLDGATVARILADLERTLTSDIVNELGYLRNVQAA